MLEALSRSEPRNPQVWNLLGIARGEAGSTKSAETAFQRGLQLAESDSSLNENLGLLLFRQGEYQRAKPYLRKGSATAAVQYTLAAAEMRTGEADAARRTLIQLEPELGAFGDYWMERGRAELPQAPAKAAADFERAAALLPQPAAAWNEAARAATIEGQDEKALAYLIRARAAAPDDPATLLHFAEICLRRDLGPDAIEAAQRALRLTPNNVQASFLLARSYIATQDWQKALSQLGRVTSALPRFAPAHYAAAWVDLRLNDREQARLNLQRALDIEPKYTDALSERAQMDLEDGDLALAERDAQAALKTNSVDARANQIAGDIFVQRGDLPAARAAYRRAVAANPNASAPRYKLAAVLGRLGMAAEARQERASAQALAAAEKQAAHTQLRLVLPDQAAPPTAQPAPLPQ